MPRMPASPAQGPLRRRVSSAKTASGVAAAGVTAAGPAGRRKCSTTGASASEHTCAMTPLRVRLGDRLTADFLQRLGLNMIQLVQTLGKQRFQMLDSIADRFDDEDCNWECG